MRCTQTPKAPILLLLPGLITTKMDGRISACCEAARHGMAAMAAFATSLGIICVPFCLGRPREGQELGNLENVYSPLPSPPLTLSHSPGLALKGLLLLHGPPGQPFHVGSPRHRSKDL